MRPLSCAEAKEEAARRVFEPLEPHTEATLTAHLAACSDCRVHADGVARVAGMLGRSILQPDPPDDLEDAVVRAVGAGPVPGRRAWRRPVLAAAATVLVLSGFGLVLTDRATPTGGRAALLATDRAAHAIGTADVLGESGNRSLRLQVRGLPAVHARAAYGVWVTDAAGAWAMVGEFSHSSIDNTYFLGRREPTAVKVTIEQRAAWSGSPGLEVLSARW